MTPFEFASAFFSIVFGLALTHIMSGVAHLVQQGRRDSVRFWHAAFLTLVIILNWWVAFAWRDHQAWTFDSFLIVVLWGMSFFAAAIALLPPGEQPGSDPMASVRNFLRAFLLLLALDVASTAVRSALFTPWYYLLFVAHYAVIAVAALLVKDRKFQNAVAIYYFVSLLVWSLLVRRLLV